MISDFSLRLYFFFSTILGTFSISLKLIFPVSLGLGNLFNSIRVLGDEVVTGAAYEQWRIHCGAPPPFCEH